MFVLISSGALGEAETVSDLIVLLNQNDEGL